jgi:hypothetical protein
MQNMHKHRLAISSGEKQKKKKTCGLGGKL